jgi:hypothetical protein
VGKLEDQPAQNSKPIWLSASINKIKSYLQGKEPGIINCKLPMFVLFVADQKMEIV